MWAESKEKDTTCLIVTRVTVAFYLDCNRKEKIEIIQQFTYCKNFNIIAYVNARKTLLSMIQVVTYLTKQKGSGLITQCNE